MSTHQDQNTPKEPITTGLPTTVLGNLLDPGQGGGVAGTLVGDLPAGHTYKSAPPYQP